MLRTIFKLRNTLIKANTKSLRSQNFMQRSISCSEIFVFRNILGVDTFFAQKHKPTPFHVGQHFRFTNHLGSGTVLLLKFSDLFNGKKHFTFGDLFYLDMVALNFVKIFSKNVFKKF